MDLQLEGQPFELVAMDGVPIAQHDPGHPTRIADHVLLPPAGRLEAIVTGPSADTSRHLISRCVDTGPEGDPNPAMILADIAARPAGATTPRASRSSVKPDTKTLDLTAEENSAPKLSLPLRKIRTGFTSTARSSTPDADPMLHVKVGTYQHWRIVNATGELHPMHIHQVHFSCVLLKTTNPSPIRSGWIQ